MSVLVMLRTGIFEIWVLRVFKVWQLEEGWVKVELWLRY